VFSVSINFIYVGTKTASFEGAASEGTHSLCQNSEEIGRVSEMRRERTRTPRVSEMRLLQGKRVCEYTESSCSFEGKKRKESEEIVFLPTFGFLRYGESAPSTVGSDAGTL